MHHRRAVVLWSAGTLIIMLDPLQCAVCRLTHRVCCPLLSYRRVLQDQAEHAMVRHEAAEALGSIASLECIALLQEYSSDRDPIVAHSCIVALDMLRHEQSGELHYADMGREA
jgi:PBS lyase HEAT-like repeat